MGWWYLSYASEKEDKFLGVCIVEAPDFLSAALRARVLKISPGGQVVGAEFPPEIPLPAGEFRNRLLSEADVKRMDPDAKSIAEYKKENLS